MLEALAVSFGVVFLAELGDKSQLMAMMFATRYRPLAVFAAIASATALMQLISVTVGAGIGAVLPERITAIVAGLVFLFFAVTTLLGGDDDEDEVAASGRSVFWTVATAFFLAEIGDKTMLATVTLAANQPVVGTWIGATAGMIAASGLAIVVGQQLSNRLPERVLRLVGAAMFAVVGVLLIISALW